MSSTANGDAARFGGPRGSRARYLAFRQPHRRRREPHGSGSDHGDGKLLERAHPCTSLRSLPCRRGHQQQPFFPVVFGAQPQPDPPADLTSASSAQHASAPSGAAPPQHPLPAREGVDVSRAGWFASGVLASVKVAMSSFPRCRRSPVHPRRRRSVRKDAEILSTTSAAGHRCASRRPRAGDVRSRCSRTRDRRSAGLGCHRPHGHKPTSRCTPPRRRFRR
jgi:hypothetical protein